MNEPVGSFWARRRAAVRAEEAAEAQTAQDADIEQKNAELEAQSDEALLAHFNLPDPDTLVQGDDFSGFMAQGIPTRLRNRALRRLWRSNPVLACVDGLNDYDGDYLTGSTGNGAIATTYQVGKGLMAHLDEMTRQADAAEAPDSAPIEPEPETPADAPVALAQAPTAEAQPAPEEAPAPTPRRMRFHFSQEAEA